MSSTMFVKFLTIIALGTLAACQSSSDPQPQILASAVPDTRMESLSNMNEEFYLNAAMAGVIGDECPTMVFDKKLYVKLEKAHIEKHGVKKVSEERKAVNKELGSYFESFRQRHGINNNKSELCIAGMREIAEQTPLSLLLTTSA